MKARLLFNSIKNNIRIKKYTRIAICILLFLYTFSIPSFVGRNPFNIIPYVLMVLLILFVVFHFVFFKKNIQIPKNLFIIPAFVSWALIGTIFYSHLFRSWLSLVLISITMMVFYFSFLIVENPFLTFKIIVFSMLAFSLYFLLVYYKDIINFKSFSGESFRLGGYFDNVNSIGSYFYFAFAFSTFIAFFGKKKTDPIFAVSSALFFVLGITTGSRNFLLVSVVSFFAIIIFRYWKKKIILLIILLSSIIAFIVLINLPLFSVVKERLTNLLNSFLFGFGASGSIGERSLWQQYGIYLGSKQMITGFGTGGFSIFSGVGTYSHANYSEIICNYGVFGFAIYYGNILYILYKSILLKNRIVKISSIFMIMFIASSFSNIFYTAKDTYIVFAICYYLINNVKQESFELLKIRFNKATIDELEVVI